MAQGRMGTDNRAGRLISTSEQESALENGLRRKSQISPFVLVLVVVLVLEKPGEVEDYGDWGQAICAYLRDLSRGVDGYFFSWDLKRGETPAEALRRRG